MTNRELLIERLIELRVQNILNNSGEVRWITDTLTFGWVGYVDHTDAELIEDAQFLELENIPTLEELSK